MRALTSGIIIFTIVALSAYDIYALIVGGADATISVVLYQATQKQPIVSFAFGVLMGHLFWHNPGGCKNEKNP